MTEVIFFFHTTIQAILQSRLIILTLYLRYFSCHISCTYDKWDEILRHNSNLSMYIWIYKDISINGACIWHIFIIFCECNIMLPVVRWRILFINKTKQSWTHFIKYLNQYFFPVLLNIFVWVIFTCVFIFLFINMPLFLHVLIKFNMTVKSGRRYLFTFIGNLQTKAENRSYEIIK